MNQVTSPMAGAAFCGVAGAGPAAASARDIAVVQKPPAGTEVIKVIATTSPKPVFRSDDTREADIYRTFKANGEAAVRDTAFAGVSYRVEVPAQ